MENVELHVIFGIISMLVFLNMVYAYVQTDEAVFGLRSNSSAKDVLLYATFALVGAALFVVLFFYNMHDQERERIGKVAGLVASGVAYVKFDELTALTSRTLGAGLTPLHWLSWSCYQR